MRLKAAIPLCLRDEFVLYTLKYHSLKNLSSDYVIRLQCLPHSLFDACTHEQTKHNRRLLIDDYRHSLPSSRKRWIWFYLLDIHANEKENEVACYTSELPTHLHNLNWMVLWTPHGGHCVMRRSAVPYFFFFLSRVSVLIDRANAFTMYFVIAFVYRLVIATVGVVGAAIRFWIHLKWTRTIRTIFFFILIIVNTYSNAMSKQNEQENKEEMKEEKK